MKNNYFNEYLHYENLGMKQKAKEAVADFIHSFNNFEEKETWTKEYLPNLKRNKHSRIRNELFEEILFPVLLHAYENKNVSLMLWLAKTSQNFYQNKKLWEKIDYKTDLEIIKECYEIDSNNNEVIDMYLELEIRGMQYSIHEWPTGILNGNNFAAKDECKMILKEIPFFHKLDKDNKYFDYIQNYENCVKEYLER
jgi:hypothetical protein